MGIEHIAPKVKHIFPMNCILLALCSLLFFNKTIASIIDTTISIKIAIMKSQNKIMVGAFSINNTSLILMFWVYSYRWVYSIIFFCCHQRLVKLSKTSSATTRVKENFFLTDVPHIIAQDAEVVKLRPCQRGGVPLYCTVRKRGR